MNGKTFNLKRFLKYYNSDEFDDTKGTLVILLKDCTPLFIMYTLPIILEMFCRKCIIYHLEIYLADRFYTEERALALENGIHSLTLSQTRESFHAVSIFCTHEFRCTSFPFHKFSNVKTFYFQSQSPREKKKVVFYTQKADFETMASIYLVHGEEEMKTLELVRNRYVLLNSFKL